MRTSPGKLACICFACILSMFGLNYLVSVARIDHGFQAYTNKISERENLSSGGGTTLRYKLITPGDGDKTQETSTNFRTESSTKSAEGRKTDFNSTRKERLKLLDENCSRLGLKKPIPRADPTRLARVIGKGRLLYSDKHKLIVCVIPKCGSSSMKKILLSVEGVVNETTPQKVDPSIVHTLADKTFDLRTAGNTSAITRRLDTYFKLMIVRDPMYRLVSAYRNKLGVRYPWNKEFQSKSELMHSRYSNKTDGELATFEEFLRHLGGSHVSHYDQHWSLFHDFCSPCTIAYDFVAHMDTIDDDMHHVLQTVGMSNVNFPHNYDASKQTDAEKVQAYLKGIPAHVIKSVYEKYKIDYKLFGFPPPPMDLP